MLGEISSMQLSEWMAYYDVEHLGVSPEERADLRMGITNATAVNIARGGKGTAAKPSDFLPNFTEPDPMAAQEELLAGMRAQAAADAKNAKPPPKSKATS